MSKTFDFLFSHNGDILLSINPVEKRLERHTESRNTDWIEILNSLCRMVRIINYYIPTGD
jgi:hypothetical protein